MKLKYIFLSLWCIIAFACNKEQPQSTELVFGGQFLDLILPTPLIGELRDDVWGADNVIPRDAENGIESAEHSYWGGQIIKGDDGVYHMYPCRWREDNTVEGRSGHMTWSTSEVVHAVSDNPLGPYKVVSVIGKGHTPEIYQRPNGEYIIGVIGTKAYRSKSLNGPWEQIESKFQWHGAFGNTSNRTYAVRPDGTSIMMNQPGRLFFSEYANEDFIEVVPKSVYITNARQGDSEDPVIWRDEVQYHCLYNSPIDREGFYMRSDDGIHWKQESGFALLPNIMQHPDGTVEDWYKLERPKVLVDEYGRATHLNAAVMDVEKNLDVANDNHSSKNIVMPLRVSRRMELLNEERITKDTKEIKLKIFAERGFDPIKDIDVKSLRFGADEVVNYGGGAKAKSITKDGNDAIVIFNGEGNGFEDRNFAGKLLGCDKKGELIFGYAKMLRAASTYRDEIEFTSLNSEVADSGKCRFALYYYTKEPRILCADLKDLTTGEFVGSCSKNVDGKDITAVHFSTTGNKSLITGREYQFNIYLCDKNGEKVTPLTSKNVVAIDPDVKDEISWGKQPKTFSSKGDKLRVNYETKGDRDIYLFIVKSNPWRRVNVRKVKSVKGKGSTDIDFKVQPNDSVALGDHVAVKLILSTPDGGINGCVSNEITGRGILIE